MQCVVLNWVHYLSGNHQGLFVLSSWGGEIPQQLPVSGLGEERCVWQFSGRQTEHESRLGVGVGGGEGEFHLQRRRTARGSHVFRVVLWPTIMLVPLPRHFVLISQENKLDPLGEGVFRMEL